MAKIIWGLDFGNWSLKVARGSYDKKSDTLTVDLLDEIIYGELPCGYDAAPNEKQRAGISAFQGKYQIPPGDDLCVSVSGGEVFSRFINLPPVPESIDEIIRYEARQQIPFDIDDVVWDYQPVKEEHEIGEEIEVGLFALKKERVEELMALLEPWRKNLRVVQNAPLAVYNMLAYEGLVDEPAIVLDVGATTTDVLVVNPPRFWVRTLLVAGDDLTNALMEQFGINNAEAEKIKRAAARSQHRDQILRVLQPVFDDLTNEVQRSLGYYKSIARDVKFGRVLAMGSALKMTGLTQMLAGGLQYQVQPVTQLSRIQVADTIDQERLPGLLAGASAAIGLLVQGAGQARVRINMVPEEIAMSGAVSAKKPWLLAAAASLLVAVIIATAGEHLLLQEVLAAPQEVQWGPLDRAKQQESEYTAAVSAAKAVSSKLTGLASEGIDRDIHLRVIPAFLNTLPEDVYIPHFKVEWLEPAEIEAGPAPIGSGSAGPRGAGRRAGFSAPGPGIGAGGALDEAAGAAAREAGMAEGMAQAMASRQAMDGMRAAAIRADAGGPRGRAGGAGRGAGRGRGGGRGGAAGAAGAAAEIVAERTDKSRLVLRFAGESQNTSGKFIQTDVFEALRQAQLPDSNEDAFEEVKMIGELRDTYRDRSTLDAAAGPGEGVQLYVSFEGYAVVNVGPKPAAGAEGETKSTRSGLRR